MNSKYGLKEEPEILGLIRKSIANTIQQNSVSYLALKKDLASLDIHESLKKQMREKFIFSKIANHFNQVMINQSRALDLNI